ncbi:ABC transporter ATP-binding protein [Butyrivibrio hungatei]|uniref:ABC transporter ATP-binding protein n=2 Tax=Butyrivibrio hungatei TaxID=185008 RepID=A0A1D9P5J4_9FIRM|nr:ABC transporter ATP-binding protein [Butyrivibrio hungatei]
MKTLKLDNITKIFGTNVVLDHVTEIFRNGEITAIVAPNGTGKSTLLNVISGMILPDEGCIEYNITNTNKGVSILLAGEKNLYVKNTVEENMKYFGIINGYSNSEIKEKIEQLMRIFPDYIDLKNIIVEKLSYGQKRIVALMTSLLIDRECILLDEVTEGLDEEHINEIKKVLKRIKDETIIILVSHDHDFIADISDRTIFLKNGTFVSECGRVGLEEFKEKYHEQYEKS